MESVIEWFGFIGAWLLFAGPIYQAALEIHDQDIQRERIEAVQAQIQVPPRVSPLWWFLPPVKIYFENKRSREYQQRYLDALLPEDVEALLTFKSKATAWVMVASGGLLIAINETYTLSQDHSWSDAIFVIVVVVLSFLSILNTVTRMTRRDQIVASTRK